MPTNETGGTPEPQENGTNALKAIYDEFFEQMGKLGDFIADSIDWWKETLDLQDEEAPDDDGDAPDDDGGTGDGDDDDTQSVPPITNPGQTRERLEDIDQKIELFLEEMLTGVPRSDPRHIRGQIKEWAVKFKKQVVLQTEQRGSLKIEVAKLAEEAERARVDAQEAEERKKIVDERAKAINAALEALQEDLQKAVSAIPEAHRSISNEIKDNTAKLQAALGQVQAARNRAEAAIAGADAQAASARRALKASRRLREINGNKLGLEESIKYLKESSISYEAAAEVLVDKVLCYYKRLHDNVQPPDQPTTDGPGTPDPPPDDGGVTTPGGPSEGTTAPEDRVADPEADTDDEAGVRAPEDNAARPGDATGE